MHTSGISRTENNFNLIRLILAGSVVFTHSWSLVYGNYRWEPLFFLTGRLTLGAVAVDAFFLLSGYLIFQSWVKAPHIVPFALKRILRICPAFVLASFVSVVIGACVAGYDLTDFLFRWKVLWRAVTLARPIDPHTGNELNVSLWSIRYEFLCYILVGVSGVAGLLRKRMPWLVLGAGSICVSMLDLSLLDSRIDSVVRLAPYFLTGGLFYLYGDKIIYTRRNALLALALLAFGFFEVRFASALLPLAGGYVLFHLSFFKAPWVARLTPVSDISYGLYLYGWPIQKMLVVFLAVSSPWALFGMSLPLAALLGFLSWRFLEKPALDFKRFLRTKNPAVGSAAVVGPMGCEILKKAASEK